MTQTNNKSEVVNMRQHVTAKSAIVRGVATVLLGVPLLIFSAGCAGKESNASSTADNAATQETTAAQDVAAESTETENTYTGTIRILTGQDLFDMQDEFDDPAIFEVDSPTRYAVLMLDPAQKVYARFAGDPEAMKDEETDMICLAIDGDAAEGSISAWEQYDGQKVTVTIDPMQTMWPSDVRLPINTPHTSTAAVVSE